MLSARKPKNRKSVILKSGSSIFGSFRRHKPKPERLTSTKSADAADAISTGKFSHISDPSFNRMISHSTSLMNPNNDLFFLPLDPTSQSSSSQPTMYLDTSDGTSAPDLQPQPNGTSSHDLQPQLFDRAAYMPYPSESSSSSENDIAPDPSRRTSSRTWSPPAGVFHWPRPDTPREDLDGRSGNIISKKRSSSNPAKNLVGLRNPEEEHYHPDVAAMPERSSLSDFVYAPPHPLDIEQETRAPSREMRRMTLGDILSVQDHRAYLPGSLRSLMSATRNAALNNGGSIFTSVSDLSDPISRAESLAVETISESKVPSITIENPAHRTPVFGTGDTTASVPISDITESPMKKRRPPRPVQSRKRPELDTYPVNISRENILRDIEQPSSSPLGTSSLPAKAARRVFFPSPNSTPSPSTETFLEERMRAVGLLPDTRVITNMGHVTSIRDLRAHRAALIEAQFEEMEARRHRTLPHHHHRCHEPAHTDSGVNNMSLGITTSARENNQNSQRFAAVESLTRNNVGINNGNCNNFRGSNHHGDCETSAPPKFATDQFIANLTHMILVLLVIAVVVLIVNTVMAAE